MKTCPPKPGFTDITSTKSTSAAISSMRRHRRRGIEHDAGLRAELLDLRDRAMQVRQHLDVDRHHVRAGVDERLEVAIGLADHQVHVERQRRGLAQRLHDRHADGDVRHEVSVHHVDVNLIGAAARRGRDRPRRGRAKSAARDRRRARLNRCHRLTSSAIGITGVHLVAAGGVWRTTTPGGIADATACAVIDTRKPRDAHHVGGAIAVQADQVGHHVGGAIFTAIHEQADFRGLRRRRRILRDHHVGRIQRRANLGDRADEQAVLRHANLGRPLRLADQARRARDVRAGAQPDANAALTAHRRAGRRILAEHVPGGHLGIGPAAFVDAQLQVEAGALGGGVGDRLADQIRHRDLAGANRHAHGNARKQKKGAGQCAREQQDLAVVPDAGSKSATNRAMVLHEASTRRKDGAEEGFEAVAERQRLVRRARAKVGPLAEEARRPPPRSPRARSSRCCRRRGRPAGRARPRGSAAGAAPPRSAAGLPATGASGCPGSRRTVPRPEHGASIRTTSKAASRNGSGPCSATCTTAALATRHRASVRLSSRTRCGRTSQATTDPCAPVAALSATVLPPGDAQRSSTRCARLRLRRARRSVARLRPAR